MYGWESKIFRGSYIFLSCQIFARDLIRQMDVLFYFLLSL